MPVGWIGFIACGNVAVWLQIWQTVSNFMKMAFFDHNFSYYWLNNYSCTSKRVTAWRLREQPRITCCHISPVFSRAWFLSSTAYGQKKQHAPQKGSGCATFGGNTNQPPPPHQLPYQPIQVHIYVTVFGTSTRVMEMNYFLNIFNSCF